jgi:hypothetical protein
VSLLLQAGPEQLAHAIHACTEPPFNLPCSLTTACAHRARAAAARWAPVFLRATCTGPPSSSSTYRTLDRDPQPLLSLCWCKGAAEPPFLPCPLLLPPSYAPKRPNDASHARDFVLPILGTCRRPAITDERHPSCSFSLNYMTPHRHTLSTALLELSLAVDDPQPTPSIEECRFAAELRCPQSTPPLSESRPCFWCTHDTRSPLKLVPLILIHRRHQRAAADHACACRRSMVSRRGTLLSRLGHPHGHGPSRAGLGRFAAWYCSCAFNF